GRARKHPFTLQAAWQHTQQLAHARVHRDAPCPPGLRPGNREHVCREVHVLPFESKKLGPTESSVESKLDNRPRLFVDLSSQLLLFIICQVTHPRVVLLEELHLPHRVALDKSVVDCHVEQPLQECDFAVHGCGCDVSKPPCDVPLHVARKHLAKCTVTK